MGEKTEDPQERPADTEQKVQRSTADYWLPRLIGVAVIIALILVAAIINQIFATRNNPTMEDAQIAQIQEKLKVNPGDYGLNVDLGNAYLEFKEYDKAIAQFQKIGKLYPKVGVYHYGLAKVYYEQGKTDKALAELNASLKKFPWDAGSNLLLGEILLDKKEYSKAEEAFKKLTQSDPTLADSHYLLGVTYEKQGRNDLAINEYREALRLYPNYNKASESLKRLERK